MQFSEIIGQDETKQLLLRAVQTNHLAHALLFDGPEGSANLALALALAQYVNCEDRQADDSCGRCASCIKTQKLVHPDLHMVFPVANLAKGKTSEAYLTDWRSFLLESPYRTLPNWLESVNADNKQGNISAEEARTILQKLSLKAYEGAYKIMLIWLPELMNTSSANALLKVLEEPPAQTLFLLVTNQPDKLLITILSRTQRVAIRAFTDEEVATYLRQHLNFDETTARRLAYLADGNLAEALTRSKQDTASVEQHNWFAEWMRTCYRQDLIELVKQADQFDGFSKEKQKGLLEYSIRLYRDLFLWQQGAAELLRLPDNEMAFVKNFAKILTTNHIERIVNDLNEATYHLERNARAKMIMLDMSLTFSRLIKTKL
ncbi:MULTISPECIES: DNA polymerase III subunit delta' [unclassified Spirosoma]|uniref:DNA polymerase III subunit delta' n=1 Tax=unclassified Spirosoma TaxID=2621999 RepID=UPI0009657AE3|nr:MULTISPECIES: DNA polymerase III subunit delta' [unclassified Spirosoma]MBN8822708.1 DNA polymerase III subunit delta' [Spirosoma sp.]OJW79921.1 MAG: DNA polymerase III subunit delta' [Spirosoma sp. 48-14]